MKQNKVLYIMQPVVLLLLLNLPHCSFGQIKRQFKAHTITGKVVDSLTKRMIPASSIYLYRKDTADGRPMKTVIGDAAGNFKITAVQPGNYLLKVSALGYATSTEHSININNGNVDLGMIGMSAANHQLQQVAVYHKTPLVQIKTDRLIYNTALDPTLSGGNAADALRKVPLLSVDAMGNVSLKGDRNVRILLDGKPSGAMNNNMADALKMIPADQIKNIEVITSPSSKYDAEGGSGIIIINTKRNSTDGVHGSYSGGLGTRQNNFNGNISIRKSKLGMNANLGNSWSWPVDTRITFDQELLNKEQYIEQETESRNKRNGLRGSLSLDYELDSNNLLISNFNIHQLTIQTDNLLKTSYAISAPISSINNNQVRFGGFDWSTDYIRKFQKKNQELNFSVQLSKNNTNTNYQSFFLQNNFRPDEKGLNAGANKEVTIQLDYTHPIKKATLELGAKAIFRDIQSTIQVDTIGQENVYLNVSQRTYNFSYRQDVGAIYSTLQIPLNTRTDIKAGVRYEYTRAEIKAIDQQASFRDQQHNILPSAVISYKVSEQLNLKISYNQRMQRPSLYFLNPFRNESDPVNQLQGNPQLAPELSHNMELSTHLTMKKYMLNLSLYRRRNSNVIESIYRSTNNNGKPIVLQTFANIGETQSFGTNIFASVDLFKILTLRGNIDLYTFHIQPKDLYGNLTHQANKTFINYKTFISGTVDLKKGWIAESFIFFDAPERTFQGHYASFNMWNLSVKKEILKKKGTLGLTMVDPFQKVKNLGSYAKTDQYEQYGNFAIPFRSFGINFSWKFGKSNSQREKYDSNIKNDDQKSGGESNM
ncbi:TonB-dependent receptor [Sphingobacterium sp. MYb388]|uniref:TonB-dependent receptor n=1 Tax=Sphingobacterium sp. MYb388 TaxID=2745437 RepID=UPI0030ABD1A1